MFETSRLRPLILIGGDASRQVRRLAAEKGAPLEVVGSGADSWLRRGAERGLWLYLQVQNT